MGGRGGRGGGRGGLSFKLEGILGVGETIPGPCLQPAPNYPPLEHHPTPLALNPTCLAQLSSKISFLSYLSRDVKSLNYSWDYFPYELRPGTRKRKAGEKTKPDSKTAPVTSIDQLLADLEKTETTNVKVETEESEEKGEGEEGREEEEFEESDEEMDDGTDYNQNYFDNGEGYLEEDDDMDDGPTY